ncbi:MAG: hypothetical protein AABW92_02375, partial [Nanoarchaeota archaeon]
MAKMNSKSVFFSIVSVFIVLLLVAFAELSNSYVAQETELELTRRRVNLVNNIISDMEDSYFEKIVYVSVKNAMIGISHYYSDERFSTNALEKFLEYALVDVIYNGTLKDAENNNIDLTEYAFVTYTAYGNTTVIKNYMNYDYTLTPLVNEVSDVFDSLGLEVNRFDVEIEQDSLRQKDPWTLEIKADVIYDIRDKTGIASWKGITTKTIDISVYGLYAFDYEGGEKSNFGVITNSWVVDNSPY